MGRGFVRVEIAPFCDAEAEISVTILSQHTPEPLSLIFDWFHPGLLVFMYEGFISNFSHKHDLCFFDI